MSYNNYRGDYSDSDATESSHEHPPAQVKSRRRNFEPISDSSDSEESSATISNIPNGKNNLGYMNGHSSSSSLSQVVTQIQRIAASCNVQKLKHILSSYGVRNLSNKRKGDLVEKIGTCYADLDEEGRKLLQELLTDPSGNSSRASSSLTQGYAASSSNNHRHRAPSPEVGELWKVKKTRKTVMDSDEDDDDYEPVNHHTTNNNHHNDEEDEVGEAEHEASPIQPSKFRRRHQPVLSDSDSSAEFPPPRRNPKKAQSSKDKSSSNNTAATSPASSRSRIVLTLPKTYHKPSSSHAPHQTQPAHNGPGQVTMTYPNGTSTTLINNGLTDPRQPRSTIRPYVPRNPATAGSNTVLNPAAVSGWPPPLPVEPSGNNRKRSVNEYLNDRMISSEMDAMVSSSNAASPTKRTFSPGQLNSFTPVSMSSGYLHSYAQYPPPSFNNNNNNNNNHNQGASNAGTSNLRKPPASASSPNYFYPPPPPNAELSFSSPTAQNGTTSQGLTTVQHSFNSYLRSVSGGGESGQPGNHIATLSLRRDAGPVSNSFTAASVLLASRDNGRTWHPPGQVNGNHYRPPPANNASRLSAQIIQPTSAARIAPASAGGTPSIMNNNPFAQAFANSTALTESGADGSSANKVVKFSVSNMPTVKMEDQDPLQNMFQRVIKPAVFHQLLFEVGIPMSIRKDQTMSSRGVYREILTTFFFDKSSVNTIDSDTLLLVRFCHENPMMANYESHPDNLKLMLNGKTLVEPAVVDFSNRMKKKKNPVFNQPVEVPWDLLAAQNVILVRWTEDTAGTTPGQPVPAADEPPKEFYMVLECVRRKTMEEILQTVAANTVPLEETIYKIYQALGVGDGDIVADSQKISLLCPASRQRLNLPIRGRHCDHIECFDASSFLYMNKAAKARWTCPKCNKPVHFDEIVVDEFIGSLLHEFSATDCIEATYENGKVVIREAKKAQKSESKPVVSVSKSSSSLSAQASTSTAPASATASRAPPEIITLD